MMTGKACAAGDLCKDRQTTLHPNRHKCPDCQLPVHGVQCGVPSGKEGESLVLGTRCFLCDKKLKRTPKTPDSSGSKRTNSKKTNAAESSPLRRIPRGHDKKKRPPGSSGQSREPQQTAKKKKCELPDPFSDLTFESRDKFVVALEVDQSATKHVLCRSVRCITDYNVTGR
jgi:hypothetical protein